MKLNYRYILILCIAFCFSCKSKKTAKSKKSKTETVIKKDKPKPDSETKSPKEKTRENPVKPPSSVEAYIELYAPIAVEEMKTSKIPASITLAQGILESGSGKGRLAKEANNHFGIKCHGWKGAKIYHDDDRSQECFRKYKKASSSYKDHSDFLVGRKRYEALFKLRPNDYKGWARGLRKAGYATDKKYPQKLISLIERYQLYKFDDGVLGNQPKRDITPPKTVHTVIKGDTLYSLSKRYNISVEAIKRANNLNSNNLSINQQLTIPN